MMVSPAVSEMRAPNAILHYKQTVYHFLRDHPHIHKLVMLVNQAVRAMMTATMITALPFAPVTSCAIACSFSAFYWMTVEWNNCSLRFAMPAFAGAAAYHLSKEGVLHLVNGVAFRSLQGLALAFKGTWPLCLYALVVTAFVNDDVDRWTAVQLGR